MTIKKLQSLQRSPILLKPVKKITQHAHPGHECVFATETIRIWHSQLARASVGHLVIPQWGAGLGAPLTSGSFAQKGAM